jgi:hypothetical protein
MSNFLFINNPYILSQYTNIYGEYIDKGDNYDYTFYINVNTLLANASSGITGLFSNACYRQNSTISYNNTDTNIGTGIGTDTYNDIGINFINATKNPIIPFSGPTNNLFVWYKFMNNNLLIDSSGNNYNLTLVGTPTIPTLDTVNTINGGNSIKLAVNQGALINTCVFTDYAPSSFTICFWYKIQSYSTSGGYFDTLFSMIGGSILQITTNMTTIFVKINNANQIYNDIAFPYYPDNTWRHYTITISKNTPILNSTYINSHNVLTYDYTSISKGYVNGNYYGTSNSIYLRNYNITCYIADNKYCGINGNISDFRIYKYALSNNEIYSIFSGGNNIINSIPLSITNTISITMTDIIAFNNISNFSNLNLTNGTYNYNYYYGTLSITNQDGSNITQFPGPQTNLLLWYKFEDNTDSSGNNNNFILINTPTYDTTNIKRGTKSIYFNDTTNASTSGVRCNNLVITNTAVNGLTICFWYKVSDYNPRGEIILTYGTSNVNNINISRINNTLNIQLIDNIGTLNLTTINFNINGITGTNNIINHYYNDNTWRHFTFILTKTTQLTTTYTDSYGNIVNDYAATAYLYINGNLINYNESFRYLKNVNTTLYLSCGINGVNGYSMFGWLNDFRIYNISLNINDLSTIILSSNDYPTLTNINVTLLAWYKMNCYNTYNDYLKDSTGNYPNLNVTNNSTSVNPIKSNYSAIFSWPTFITLSPTLNLYTIQSTTGINIAYWCRMSEKSGGPFLYFNINNIITTHCSIDNKWDFLISKSIYSGTKVTKYTTVNNYVDGLWHHVVWSIDNTGFWRIWIDGIQLVGGEGNDNIINLNISNLQANNIYYLGRTNNSYLGDGNMSDFRIYSGTLTTVDVNQLYTGTIILNSSNINIITNNNVNNSLTIFNKSYLMTMYKFDPSNIILDSINNINLINTNVIVGDLTNPNGSPSVLFSDSSFMVSVFTNTSFINGFTLSFWYYCTTSNYQTLFNINSYETSLTNYISALNVNVNYNNESNVYLNYNSGPATIVNTLHTINTWNHIAITIDTFNNLIFYYNGVATYTYMGAYTQLGIYTKINTYLHIGSNQQSTSYFNGYQSDYKIYNIALPPSRIIELYNGTGIGNLNNITTNINNMILYNAGTSTSNIIISNTLTLTSTNTLAFNNNSNFSDLNLPNGTYNYKYDSGTLSIVNTNGTEITLFTGPTTNLLIWYKFADNTNSCGNYNNITLNNATLDTTNLKKGTASIYFNNISNTLTSYANCGSLSIASVALTGFTICFWYKANTYGNQGEVILTYNDFVFYRNNYTLNIYNKLGSYVNNYYNDNVWRHCTFVLNKTNKLTTTYTDLNGVTAYDYNGTGYLYLNGALCNTGNTIIFPRNLNYNLYLSGNTNGTSMRGWINDFRIYTVPLKVNDILTIMLSSNTFPEVKTNATLIGWYKLDFHSINTKIDSSEGNLIFSAVFPMNLRYTNPIRSTSYIYILGSDNGYYYSSLDFLKIQTSTGITICYWCKMNTISSANSQIFNYYIDTFRYIKHSRNNDQNNWCFTISKYIKGVPTIYEYKTTFNYVDNMWHHVVWAIDDVGIWSIWIDGIQYVGGNTISIICDSVPIYNNNYTRFGVGYDGAFSDIRYYSGVLTTIEVNAIYMGSIILDAPTNNISSINTNTNTSIIINPYIIFNNLYLLSFYQFTPLDLILDSGSKKNNLKNNGVIVGTLFNPNLSPTAFFDGISFMKSTFTNYPFANGFSTSFWYYCTSNRQNQVLFTLNYADLSLDNKSSYAGPRVYVYLCYNGVANNISFFYTNIRTISNTLHKINTWNHFALTIDSSSNINIYFNGVNVYNSGITSSWNSYVFSMDKNAYLHIGGIPSIYDNYYIGYLSDYKIYGTALSFSQITSLKNNNKLSDPTYIIGYMGTPANPNLFDINITLPNHNTFQNWNTVYNNKPLYKTVIGKSNVSFSTFKSEQITLGYTLLEVVAHKLFGHAQAHAAISNDDKFYLHDAEIWDHLSNTIANSNFSNNIFKQYVALGRYNAWAPTSANDVNNSNDVNGWVNFNFINLTFDYPLFVSGNLLLNSSLTPGEINVLQNGPNIGGTLLVNGSYNIPILVRLHD